LRLHGAHPERPLRASVPRHASTTLQRAIWDGHPVTLGTGFELRKRKGDRELRAVCSLQTHQLGFELVLEVNGLLSRSQVCRSRDEVLDVCEQWRAVMLSALWQ
jgi:hypothetical protein